MSDTPTEQKPERSTVGFNVVAIGGTAFVVFADGMVPAADIAYVRWEDDQAVLDLKSGKAFMAFDLLPDDRASY